MEGDKNAASDATNRLVSAAMDGDQRALSDLLSHYQNYIYSICYRMARNPDDAAELTQDVLMKVVKSLQSFNRQSQFKTWISRIAVNTCISHGRKAKLRQTTSIDQNVGRTDDQAASLKEIIANRRELTSEQHVDKQEQIQRLLQKLDELDPDLKMVIVLRDLQQIEYQEMAATLELPLGTIKSRLFRARIALREAMTAESAPR